jgi:RsiW-degrading membrane proteinase PrsW (M82 family)
VHYLTQAKRPVQTSGASGAAVRAVAPRGRTEQAARVALVPVLLVGVVLFALVREVLISTQNPNLVPAMLLLGAAVVPITFVTLIDGLRLSYTVQPAMIALTAGLGGAIGVITAGLLEYDTLHRLPWLGIVAVAAIEETAKLLVPLAILLWGKYRRPADGLIIGVAAGAGFAVLETMGYAFVTLIESHGNIGTVDGLLVLRGLLSPAAHMAWTGLTAAALWQAAAQHWSRRGNARLVAVFVLTVALHATWDGVHTLAAYIALAAVGLGALYLTIRSLRDPSQCQLFRSTQTNKETHPMNSSMHEAVTAPDGAPKAASHPRRLFGIATLAVLVAFGAGTVVDHTVINGGSSSIDAATTGAAPQGAQQLGEYDHGAFSIQETITNDTDQNWTLASAYTFGSTTGGHWGQRPQPTLDAGKSEVVSAYSDDVLLGEEFEVGYTMPNGDYVVTEPADGWTSSNEFSSDGVFAGNDAGDGWQGDYDKNFTATATISHGDHCDASLTVTPATTS